MKNKKCRICNRPTLTAEEIEDNPRAVGNSIFCTSWGHRICIDCASGILELFEESSKTPTYGPVGYKKNPIPKHLRWDVFKRDGFACKKCGTHIDLHCDHIHPESKGGKTETGNLQTLCGKCNKAKGAKI